MMPTCSSANRGGGQEAFRERRCDIRLWALHSLDQNEAITYNECVEASDEATDFVT